MRLKHYEKLAAKWQHIAWDWNGRWFIYLPDEERELERIAGLICLCYHGMADGRRSRYHTLDQLKRSYDLHLSVYEGVVEDMRRLGEICAACNEKITPARELPAGERPCGCDPTE